MMDTEATLRAYYAARAREFDKVYEKPERQTDLRQLQAWLPSQFTDARLLEIACGTGYWTRFIAPAAAEVLALDIVPETIAIAKARVESPRVRFLIADAYQLPAHEGRFTAAFAGFWFSHIPRRRRREFVDGLAKTLTPGASVVFIDNRYVEGNNLPVTESDADGNTYQTRVLEDGSIHRVLKNFPREDELLALIDGLGSQAHFTPFQYFWAFQYRAAAP